MVERYGDPSEYTASFLWFGSRCSGYAQFSLTRLFGDHVHDSAEWQHAAKEFTVGLIQRLSSGHLAWLLTEVRVERREEHGRPILSGRL